MLPRIQALVLLGLSALLLLLAGVGRSGFSFYEAVLAVIKSALKQGSLKALEP